MARTGEPEPSDDSISLTSTVSSAKTERYEVETILAERKSKGMMEYLTAWKDYPEHRHTWEPRENFSEDDVFSAWTRTQMRVTRGLEKPFDVKAWKKRCNAIKSETLLRRERRRDKKLRLGNQDELTSGPREQDVNIESSGSEPAPRSSNKRIKRRSVHEDPPPSSSISDPSSSSVSEDSDRPLISRQEPEKVTPNPKWTQAETVALEEGLRTLGGPRWTELLGLYGPDGTVSQVLKDRKPGDLYDKAKSVRQEFVDSGREPPEYLKPFSKSAYNKGSGTATPKIYSESRGQSIAASKISSRSTSEDSMMAELGEKQKIREARKRRNSRPQQTTSATDILFSARERDKGSNTAKKKSGSKPKVPQTFQAPARKGEVAFANESVKETPKAAQTKPHPTKAILHAKGTTEVKESSKDDLLQVRQPKDAPCAKEPSNVSATSQAERQPKSLTPSEKETAEPATNAAAQPESPSTDVLDNNKTMREETARTTWSGTARAPPMGPSVPRPSRLGAVGSGPARLSSSKLKPKLRQIEPKKPMMTGDVTAAWNAEPKKRKSNNWATTNADRVDGKAPKRNYRLSVQNKIYKSRRDGRAPDPDRLVFIDPKTGKAPTTVPAPSTTAVLAKTPLQLHQEDLATREAEERQAQEVENAMPVGTIEPYPPQQSIDQDCEIRADEQGVPEMGRAISNVSATALRPTAGDMTDGPAHLDSLTPLSLAPFYPDSPPNVPLGPRIERPRMATMSLQDYTKRSASFAHLLNEADIKSSDDVSMFALRNYPSREQKNEISNKLETNLVIGDIVFGKDDQESINVKLVGFGFEMKKLLLTVKSLPRTVQFVFQTVCLASEYQAYFPAVSSCCQRKSTR